PVGAVDEFAAAVDMALDDVSVEAPRGGSAALQIDAIACLEAAESGQTQGLAHHLGGEEPRSPGVLLPRRRQADAVDGQGPAEGEVGAEIAGVDGDLGRVVRSEERRVGKEG